MQEETLSAAVAADAGGFHQPVVLPHSDHGITRRDIDPSALKVLYRLSRNEFTAYLVGGGVRDLLLKRKPKDFDISTNARPDQIKSLFKNCLLIGRRFRLAHIRYGEKIIETSTFRRAPEPTADPNDPEADLFQRDDNIFGSPEEDARRRDFTVNGLFYDIESFSVIDYVGGIEDIRKRVIRSIGDPCIRFREDPVRMIRAVRFASRLDFSIDAVDLDAIQKHREELGKASPARLLEEVCRLFAFSSGEKAVGILESTGLLEVILPEIASYLAETGDPSPFWRRLAALDQGDIVLPEPTQALIFAVILFDPIKAAIDSPRSDGKDFRRRLDRVRAFIDGAAGRLSIPRKLREKLFRIIGSQSRFANPGKRRVAEAMVRQDWFPEALAFAEIDAVVEARPPAQLNPWREMYADIVCSRDEARPRGGPPRQQPQRNGNGLPQPAAERPAERGPAAAGEPSPSLPGQGLSRSARRRRNRQRNKDRRRQQEHAAETTAASAPESRSERDEKSPPPVPAPLDVLEAAKPMSAATKAELEAELKDEMREEEREKTQTDQAQPPSGRKRRGRDGGRGKNAKGMKKNAPSEADGRDQSPDAAPEAEAAPTGPLTAAAFYAKPAAKPGKPASSAGKDKKSEPPAAPKTAPASAPRGIDRAEEADTPMHWLDEI